jgi:nitroreductase
MDGDSFLELMTSRRSATRLGEPGPTAGELSRILLAATTVPDHGGLRPFRFLVAEGEGRGRFGDALAATVAEHRPGLPAGGLEKVRGKAFRSPTLVAVVASPKPGKIEIWEQHAAAACAGYAVVLAAYALGVGAVWKSVPYTKGRGFSEILGLAPDEEMLGFIHLGRATEGDAPDPRETPSLGEIATVIEPGGSRPW